MEGCRALCGKGKTLKMDDPEVLAKLEAGFQKLQNSDDCESLLRMYLTPVIFDKLKTRKTKLGATLLDVIQSGLENLDSEIGVYAPDGDSYSVFSDLINPIIENYHGGFSPSDKNPPTDFGDLDSFVHLDPEGQFVVSTRVRCARSIEGYPFNPCLTEAMYREIEGRVTPVLESLTGEIAGTYQPLTGMQPELQQQLIDDHYLFKEGDRFLQAANACRYWPTGRGIFLNDAKTFVVWINEEDHLRIISMEPGGDLACVYKRMVTGVRAMEKKLPFARCGRLGYQTFCPTNLGTTIRASVHIRLPQLAQDKLQLDETASRFHLQVRGTQGEYSDSGDGIYDISNKRRLGLSEFEAVKEMEQGITEMIKIEKSL